MPPGYDPEDIVVVNKLKTKAAKRNERKKEKRLSQVWFYASMIMLMLFCYIKMKTLKVFGSYT